MIAYYKTVNGRIEPVPQREDGCWVNVIAPDEDEFNALIHVYGVEPEFLRAALDEEESAHVDNEGGQTLVVIDVPCVEKQEENILYFTMPMGIIITERDLITVSLRENPVLMEFSGGLVKNVHTGRKTQFVLYMMLRMASRYLQYLKQIDKHTNYLESLLRKSMKNKELIQLLDLQKSLVYFQTSLKSDEVTMEKILRGRYLKLYDEDQELLEDVLIEIKQAIEMSNIYLSILSGTMDAFASVISNNLNIVMKVLTSITIVMAIPTMIFSYYGMNIGDGRNLLPLSGSIFYPLIIAVVLTGVVGIILYKKKMF